MGDLTTMLLSAGLQLAPSFFVHRPGETPSDGSRQLIVCSRAVWSGRLSPEQLFQLVFEEMLHSNLRRIVRRPSLPQDVSRMHGKTLQGSYIVQVGVPSPLPHVACTRSCEFDAARRSVEW